MMLDLYLAATPTDVADAAQKVPNLIFALWKTLVFDNNVLFQTISTPFKLVAVMGFLYQITPLLAMDSHHRRQALRSTIGMILVLFLFLNNCDGWRKVVVIEYAFAKGAATAIERGFEVSAGTAAIGNNIEGNIEAINQVQAAVKSCMALPPIVDGVTSPVYTKCVADARALVRSKISSGEIQDTTLTARWEKAISATNPISMLGGLLQAVGRLGDEAVMAAPRAILSGLTALNATIGDIAMLISAIASPIPLCLSMFNQKPLFVWHGAFWGAALFSISNSIVVGIYRYMEAKLPATETLFSINIAIAVLSPIISGLVAAGGGIAVYTAFQQVTTGIISTAGAAIKGAK
jgi:hypothetical protein